MKTYIVILYQWWANPAMFKFKSKSGGFKKLKSNTENKAGESKSNPDPNPTKKALNSDLNPNPDSDSHITEVN